MCALQLLDFVSQFGGLFKGLGGYGHGQLLFEGGYFGLLFFLLVASVGNSAHIGSLAVELMP